MKKTVSRILILTMLCLVFATVTESLSGAPTAYATVVNPDGVDKSDTDETAADNGSDEKSADTKTTDTKSEKKSDSKTDSTDTKASEKETAETKPVVTTEEAGIKQITAKEAPKDCVIPDDADFKYEDILYKPATAYNSEREPMNAVKMEVTYKGTKYPAYYWAPGDMVVLLVGLADTDVTPWEELSQSDQDTWKSWMSEKYATPEEAYYADALPTYTFFFDFEQNKIRPFVEFQYGPEGKVVMTDFNEDQAYYLDALSPSFLKLGNFEFDVYQFLTVNDDTCYYIFSGLDQLGNCYLYQYDSNGNCCSRADMNLLIAVKYLEERTIALNQYVDTVQHYQDVVRKIIAGIIFTVLILAIVFINLAVKKKMSTDDDEDEEDEEDEDDEDEDDDDEVVNLSDDIDDIGEVESDDEDGAPRLDPEIEFFYEADTEKMREMFRTPEEEQEPYYDDIDYAAGYKSDDETDDDDEIEDLEDLEDIEDAPASKPQKQKPEKVKKEKAKKEKVKKEKPAKKHGFSRFKDDDDSDDEVLDLNDL